MTETTLRPLSARSVVLSLMLGAHPAELSAAALVRAGELFDVSETTLRAALSRLLASGDLLRDSSGTYRLSKRLLERQRRQDAVLDVATTEWDGTWEQVVVTSSGRSAHARAELRVALTALRLAELREGVWLRPANLERPLPDWPADLLVRFTVGPVSEPAALGRRLWDVEGWAARGRALLEAMAAPESPRDALTLNAAAVRHLLVDPALPRELMPDGWPSQALRAAYDRYRAELPSRLNARSVLAG
jgi:phenylacetic acid degradation operon negative regulatory protein